MEDMYTSLNKTITKLTNTSKWAESRVRTEHAGYVHTGVSLGKRACVFALATAETLAFRW